MDDRIPALSIRQPWVWAIIHAWKGIENRDWNTKYRGPILLHASKGMTRAEYDDAIQMVKHAQKAGCAPTTLLIPKFEQLQRGGIVGRADLVDVITESTNPYFFGKYGFVLKNARPVPFVECSGKQGYFYPDVQVAA